ncbi:MAG: hypothetical protein IPK80_14920 [Nannocystis sp.]|nr:hypothetical protein [Nannocystis sp.]
MGIVVMSSEIDAELDRVAVKTIAYGLVGLGAAIGLEQRGARPAGFDVEVIVEAVVGDEALEVDARGEASDAGEEHDVRRALQEGGGVAFFGDSRPQKIGREGAKEATRAEFRGLHAVGERGVAVFHVVVGAA